MRVVLVGWGLQALALLGDRPQRGDRLAREPTGRMTSSGAGRSRLLSRLRAALALPVAAAPLVPGGLEGHRPGLERAFQARTVAFQATWDEWGRGYRQGQRGAEAMSSLDLPAPELVILPVGSRAEALTALRAVAEQGEGFETPPDENDSHFRPVPHRLPGVRGARATASVTSSARWRGTRRPATRTAATPTTRTPTTITDPAARDWAGTWPTCATGCCW